MIHVAPCARTLDAPKPYLENEALKLLLNTYNESTKQSINIYSSTDKA